MTFIAGCGWMSADGELSSRPALGRVLPAVESASAYVRSRSMVEVCDWSVCALYWSKVMRPAASSISRSMDSRSGLAPSIMLSAIASCTARCCVADRSLLFSSSSSTVKLPRSSSAPSRLTTTVYVAGSARADCFVTVTLLPRVSHGKVTDALRFWIRLMDKIDYPSILIQP